MLFKLCFKRKNHQNSQIIPDLSERRPFLLPSLRQAVVVVAVCLKDIRCAQFVQRFERHSRCIPEAHCTVLMTKKNKIKKSS